MDYNIITLSTCGLFGIIVHNLMKIDTLNKRDNGNFNFNSFIRLEWPSISLSVCVVIVALIARTEVKQLREVGSYLMLGMFAIGYLAQSIIYHFLGKAQKKMDE